MGSKFVEGRSVEFSKSYEESSPSTPIFFILSPGVDPLKDVEALGKCPPETGPVSASSRQENAKGNHSCCCRCTPIRMARRHQWRKNRVRRNHREGWEPVRSAWNTVCWFLELHSVTV